MWGDCTVPGHKSERYRIGGMTEDLKNSKIGKASFIVGIIATGGWLIVLVGSVIAAAIGATENKAFLTVIGANG